jgi:hypothetical protein
LSKKQKTLSRKAIEEVAHKNTNFVNSSIELRIVLRILQQSDQFAQKKRLKLLRQSLKRRNSNVIQKKENEK